MTRRGLLLCLLPTLILLTFSGTALFAQTGSSDPNWAPTITLPNDSAVVWCVADSICYEVSGYDPDASDSIWMSLVSGPIEFTPIRFGREFNITICFRPEGSGEFPFIWQFVDRQNHVVIDTVIYAVELGMPPTIDDQQFSATLCDLQTPRVLTLAYAAEGRPVTFELLFGPGVIDPLAGIITYEPDTSGVFSFEVELETDCGLDTAVITDQLALNLPPYCIGFDSTIYLCDVQQICFDVFAHDPEGDDIQISMPEGLGTFVQTGDTSGQTCFTPRNVDSARYFFIFRAADSCVLNAKVPEGEPYCCIDTVVIDVIITQPGELSCPVDTTLKLCIPPETLPATICLPGFSSTWASSAISFGTLSGDTLCFETDTLGVFAVRFIGSDTCGHADTCETTIKVVGNSEPTVLMADDYGISLCAPETICFAASYGDADFDVNKVEVNYGQFNQSAGTICFDADTTGVYAIVLTVTDTCGSWAKDTTLVNVAMHEAPTVSLGEDRQITLCERQEICLDAIITGENIQYFATSTGAHFDQETGQICFTPEESGQYEIFLQAVDDCERVVADTVLLDVTVGHLPTITDFNDSTIYLCYPREICLDLNIADMDDDIVSVVVSRGKYKDGQFCFVPYGMGDYSLVVTVTDRCGHVVKDTAVVTVKTDQGFTLTAPGDTTIFLCEPDTLCFPIGGVPEGAQVTVGGIATYWNAETQSICFYSDCCLENKLTVTVKTECGTYSKSFTVDVQTNSRPLVILPQDTTMFQCVPATICLPIGINDIDGNVMSVAVSQGRYDAYDRTICLDELQEGVNTIAVTVTDSCGATATDQIAVTTRTNHAPSIEVVMPDTLIEECYSGYIQVDVEVIATDVDDNMTGEMIGGSWQRTDEPGRRLYRVRYELYEFGHYDIPVIVFDGCGLADTGFVSFTAVQIPPVAITCPEAISHVQCGPGQICVDVPISGELQSVSTNYGVWADGKWCIDLTEPIVGTLEIIAVGECNTDTCNVPLNLFPVESPQLVCPADVDTADCPAGVLRFEVPLLSAPGPNESITISEPGRVTIVDRTAIVEIATPNNLGPNVVTITYSNPPCEPYVCSFTINVRGVTSPQLYADDIAFESCELEEVCVPFTYTGEGLESVVAFTDGLGSILATWGDGVGQFCFTPTSFGDHEFALEWASSCDDIQVIFLTVTVNELHEVAIHCPELFAPIIYCELGEHCIELPIDGSPTSVTSSLGTWAEGSLCFNVEQPGSYNIEVIATGPCNVDTCLIPVIITMPAEVMCSIADTTLVLCQVTPTTVRVPVTVSGDDLTIDVTPPATYADGFVTLEFNDAGVYTISTLAYNDCSRDSCAFTVHALMNTPPVVTLGEDFAVTQCEFEEICIPFTMTDSDDDLLQIQSSLGVVNGNTVCYTPKAFGTVEIILTVTDECETSTSDVIVVTVNPGQSVALTCPTEPISMNLDLPGTVRVPIGVEPAGFPVVISPSGYYDAETGEAVVTVETEGVHEFTVTSTADCNADTCGFTLLIGQYIPPVVECIGSVDTLLCLSNPIELCLPVTVYGTGVQVEVTPPAVFNGEAICLAVSDPGVYVIDIIARTDRDSATCQTRLTVTGGQPPVLWMPEALNYTLCGAGEVCFDVTMEDADFDITNIGVNYGAYDINKGQVCFEADTAGTYVIEMTVADSCGNATTGATRVAIDFNQPPQVSLGDQTDIFGCVLSEVCVDVNIVTDDNVTVVTSLGQYDPETGKICFLPTAPGNYELNVEVTDECGHKASDAAVITVDANDPPVIAPLRDTTIYLCYPVEVCIDALVSDPDGNLATVTPSRGKYADGKVCFVPYGMGDYRVVVTAVDECGATVKDTAIVTIKTDQSIKLAVPNDTTVFLCEPDTLCFPVGGVPAGANVTVRGIATWWNAETQSICFYSDCCLENTLTVSVTTACGTYSKSFTVDVQTNSRPLVLLPRDTTILQCTLAPICLPVGISDIDGNISRVDVVGGTYDAYSRTVCFTPEAAGSQTIVVTVTDSCGAIGTDRINVNIAVNQPPVITYTPVDSIYKQCVPQTICLPIDIADADGNLAGVDVSGGYYDAEAGTICILPTGIGTFCAQVTATDKCGLTAVQEVCVTIGDGDYVNILCPEGPYEPVVLCEAQSVCVDLPITGTNFAVTTSFGTWSEDQLCFGADSSGTYVVRVIASSQCGADTCTVRVPVTILEPLSLTAPANDTQFLCGVDTLCYAFAFTPGSATVTVSAPAYLSAGQVCVPVLQPGVQNITLKVTNQCGSLEKTFTVTTTFNGAPVVAAGVDRNYVECNRHEVCLPISITDPNNNIVQRTTNIGRLTSDTQLCLTPTAYGVHRVIITAVDACGLSDVDTVVVTYTEGGRAAIQCPDGTQYASVCGVDTVCIYAPVTPAGATVTVLPAGFYKPATGEVCIPVTSGGTKAITIIAAAQCESDTCKFNLEVDMGVVPVVTARSRIDTLLCLATPDTLRVPVTATGTGLQVNVNPTGYFAAGYVYLPITAAGKHNFSVIAFGRCGADTAAIEVNVTADKPPVLTLPTANLTFERCPDDVDEIAIGGIFARDVESEVTLTKICGPGSFASQSGDSGAVFFVPTVFGQTEFCFEATDGCHTVTGSFFVNIVAKPDCDVCVRLSIDGGDQSPVGLRKKVAVNIESNDPVSGFDLLIGYDKSALIFQVASINGGDADAWEYFTWNQLSQTCSTCPNGLIRFVGIADINNGAAHPPDSAFNLNGKLFEIEYQIVNDQNLGDVFVPISFVWLDCADNALSDVSGSVLYIDSRIYNPEGVIIWDEFNETLYPETSRQIGLGAPDSCIVAGSKTQAVRCVEFHNGGVKIIDPDDIDDRGDINLNNIAYEIADAVVFTNYFIRGLSAFTISIPGQIAATDVNGDGMTLTVADLTLLIRVIVGDADPLPKVTPYAESAVVSTVQENGTLRIGAETQYGIGAAYFVYEIAPGTQIGEPAVLPAADGLTVKAGIEEGKLRVLIYDIGTARIDAGAVDLIEIPISGDGVLRLTHSEIVDYQSRAYSLVTAEALPDSYELLQNYPNPFNPKTTISFALPAAADWTMRVYNITGALVWEQSGRSSGGTVDVVWDGLSLNGESVASGVYLYRLDANNFSDTRKMILLK